MSSLMPMLPITIGLSVVLPRFGTNAELVPSITSGWSQDDIDRSEPWHTDWVPSDSGGYLYWSLWQGVPSDSSWILERAYGFPGLIILQAYMDEEYYYSQRLLFRLGDRYPLHQLGSCLIFPSVRNRYFYVGGEQPKSYTCGPAITEGETYKVLRAREISEAERRNRWIEQAERGGRPHENLLFTPS
ncbi:hypothetical protein B0H14DRAFT_2859898 [Mycena olivaceomarginata]|nr:hypothetical protein B0H14DRAFT_2859898 [Mycena olivaceomarginata]